MKPRRLLRALVFGWLLIAPILCAGDDTENLRLRIAWGGGAARQWHVTMRIDDGSLAEITPLGIEPDTPGSIVAEPDTVRVLERSPRTYNGIDVTVTGSLDAELDVEMLPVEEGIVAHRERITLRELISRAVNVPADTQNNRLSIQRAPGDNLRIEFAGKSLIVAPRDDFDFTVVPHFVGLEPDTSVICEMFLHTARTDDEIWSDERELRVREDGSLPPAGPITLSLPVKEGVYDLVVQLKTRRLPTPFLRSKSVARRKLQLVSIDANAPVQAPKPWDQILEIDPANAGWWDRLRQLPQLKLIPGFGQEPLSNDKSRLRRVGDKELVELAADGWQAYPLPIDNVQQPHILEIEYAASTKQSLGISIVEPNAAQMVGPLGLDSGVDVPESTDGTSIARHRLIFWPRTKAPLVLLTNRRGDGPAVFGKLRVWAGPRNLPPAPVSDDQVAGRLLAACFDKPLFPENFGSDEALDAASGRTLDDWRTFYFGARRMIEYLKHVGHNAAVISVMTEGATIYPSALLQPTFKYDTGVYFATGQDPLRKDVLEMLFRMFDREGLKLIPALQFSGPLPELEELRRQGGAEGAGLDLIGQDGKSWIVTRGLNGGMGPYYNPLDPRVQKAMFAIVDELSERYGHHRSFAGISLQLGPDTFAQLPGEEWGYDDKTMTKFARDTGVDLTADGPDRFARRAGYLSGRGRDRWLAWRAEQMAQLFGGMQDRVTKRRKDARLYLAGADIYASRPLQRALRPTLPPQANLADALLQIGIDPNHYRDSSRTVFLLPQRMSPVTSLMAQAANVRLSQLSLIDGQIDRGAIGGSLFYHEAQPTRLAEFDALSPFGPERTETWLIPHFAPSGHHNRQRFVHSLAQLDALSMFDGGWLLPMGQEDALRDIVDAYRRLPDARFDTVQPQSDAAAEQPLVVRTLTQGRRTLIYVVNDSPWPLTATLQLSAPLGCRIDSLTRRRHVGAIGAHQKWTVTLEPYDLVAVEANAPNVKVLDWDAPPAADVTAELRNRLKQARTRAKALLDPPSIDVLENPGFDAPPKPGQIAGWVHARGETILIGSDETDAYQGPRSLRVSSRREVAWLRSDPFEPPKTGRISVIAWLKIPDADRQPPLRLAVEYLWHGRVQYKFAEVGRGERAPPLEEKWEKYVFHVDDLPAVGVTKLRVGFDLMGAGTVWIDNVQILDRWFDDNERNELSKSIALAGFQLDNNGNAVQCQRFLDSFWPRFLTEFVPVEARIAANPALEPPPTPIAPPAEPEEKPSVFDRMKDLVPKKVFPF